MVHPDIHLDYADDVATVTIDRPHRKNACTFGMWEGLRDGFRDIAVSGARAVVITGAGGEFCGGADIGGRGQGNRGQGEERDSAHRRPLDELRVIGDAVMAVHDCPKPVVAKVDGVAVGAGFGLALAADMLWCSDRARFSLIFAKRGLSLDFGSSWLLPKRIGIHEAKRLAFTGEVIGADRAAALGIVNEVVAVDDLDSAVDGMVARLVAGPPIAASITKRQLDGASSRSLFEALENESLGQSLNLTTEDVREAVKAFVEKREPKFRGR